jgi:hypothetical protein
MKARPKANRISKKEMLSTLASRHLPQRGEILNLIYRTWPFEQLCNGPTSDMEYHSICTVDHSGSMQAGANQNLAVANLMFSQCWDKFEKVNAHNRVVFVANGRTLGLDFSADPAFDTRKRATWYVF